MNKIALSVAAAMLVSSANTIASEEVKHQDLVGKYYGGIHFNLNKPDEDRLNGINDDFEVGNGFGIEAGYRYSESTEFRLSYTDLTIEFETNNDDEDGDALSLDVLYFPTKHNYYVLGGLNNLDIGETEISANLGLGYRHYFSERLAAYAEAKAHYQFDDSYIDQTAQIGLVYFFGTTKKSAPIAKPTAPAPKKVVVPKQATTPKDSDNDGVVDTKDKCPNTPAGDKVDNTGCTIFTEQQVSQRLLINFDNNKAIIKSQYVQEVAKIATFLKEYPHVDMAIEGHTSKLGGMSYNQELSEKRANAVVNMLVTKFGIEKSRLTAVGYGETRLLNPAYTEEAHAENRRIEANVSATKKVKAVK